MNISEPFIRRPIGTTLLTVSLAHQAASQALLLYGAGSARGDGESRAGGAGPIGCEGLALLALVVAPDG